MFVVRSNRGLIKLVVTRATSNDCQCCDLQDHRKLSLCVLSRKVEEDMCIGVKVDVNYLGNGYVIFYFV